jgi:hypothetical protein
VDRGRWGCWEGRVVSCYTVENAKVAGKASELQMNKAALEAIHMVTKRLRNESIQILVRSCRNAITVNVPVSGVTLHIMSLVKLKRDATTASSRPAIFEILRRLS